MNRSYNINCTFYILKTHNLLPNISFLTICCHFMTTKYDFKIAHGGHLEKWRPFWNFAWPALFSCRENLVVYVYHICCLYHNLKDSSEICNYLLHYMPFCKLQCKTWKVLDCSTNALNDLLPCDTETNPITPNCNHVCWSWLLNLGNHMGWQQFIIRNSYNRHPVHDQK